MSKCLSMQKLIDNGKATDKTHPCGYCMPCRRNRKAEYATRVAWETKYAFSAYFLTLTFNDLHLDSLPPTEWKTHMQKFIKRIRKDLKKRGMSTLRISYKFEYGSESGRPHWHMILWNFRGTHEQLQKYFNENWELGTTDISTARNSVSMGSYMGKHQTDLSGNKGDKHDYGVKPYNISPIHLGEKYIKTYKKWHQSDLNRTSAIDPAGGKGTLRMPTTWKKKLFTKTQQQKIKLNFLKLEKDEFNKLTTTEQHKQVKDIYIQAEHKERTTKNRERFFSPQSKI